MKLAKVFFENSLKSWTKDEADDKGKKLYCFLVDDENTALEGETWAAWTQNGLQIAKLVKYEGSECDADELDGEDIDFGDDATPAL